MSAGPAPECDVLRDDLAGYALGALRASEAAKLESHLGSCHSCRERLRWLAPAVDLIPTSVEQLTPPPSLRDGIMATVRAEAPAPAPKAPRERSPWWRGLGAFAMRPAVGMVSLILVVIGIGAGYLLFGGDELATPETSLTRAEVPGPLKNAVSATLERNGDSATLHVHEMPAIDRRDVYEVWVERAGTLEPRSLFVLRNDRTAEAAVPGPLENADAVYVTREPSGGSERPTGEPLLRVPL